MCLKVNTKDLCKSHFGGAWVAQSVKCLTLGFSSGHDLRDLGSSPMMGSMLNAESTCPLPQLLLLLLYTLSQINTFFYK